MSSLERPLLSSTSAESVAPAPLAYGINTGAEAAAVKRDTIYRAIARGELTARKIGSRTVILAEDLRGWLESRPTKRP